MVTARAMTHEQGAATRSMQELAPAVIPALPFPIQVGDLVIDPVAHTVTVAGHPIGLTPHEFDLLQFD